ncbi:UbiA family prenyltransferase [Candidatus Pacearchaeota archaeon]|nr:UbiA family prenyltransferase [Candidatus Pacearchaeota archaeon]
MKWTLKQSYDRVEYLPIKLRGFADLLRPFTILVAFFSGVAIAVGVLRYYNLPLHFYWKDAIYGGSVFAFVTAASNALNQYTDSAEDGVNKGYRPIPQGVVTHHEAHTIAYLLYFAGLVRAFVLSPSFGIFITLIALITIFYSLEPVRLKKRFLINNLSLAIARGYLPTIALWSIWGDLSDPLPHYFGIALVLYLMGATTTKDFPDMEGDSKQGIKTLPTTIGYGPTVATIGLFFILSYSWFYWIGMWQFVTLSPLSVAVMITLNKTSELHEYTRAWMISYINLMLFYFYWAILL